MTKPTKIGLAWLACVIGVGLLGGYAWSTVEHQTPPPVPSTEVLDIERMYPQSDGYIFLLSPQIDSSTLLIRYFPRGSDQCVDQQLRITKEDGPEEKDEPSWIVITHRNPTFESECTSTLVEIHLTNHY